MSSQLIGAAAPESFPSPSAVAQALASLALNSAGVPSPIGALILGAIFPNDANAVPAYFAQVFEEIQVIVQQEIAQNEIAVINGAIAGAVNYVITTYAGAKAGGQYTNAVLLADLTPYVTAMNLSVVMTLQEDDYNQVGFGAFLAAVPIYLSLLQEQALVDPAVPNPWESAYCSAVAMNAQNFVTFAQTNWTAIKQARQNQVTVTSNYGPTEAAEGIESEGFPTLPPYICYSWVDSATAATGAQYCGYGWPTDSDQQHRLAQAQADCVTEQASVVTVLTATLGDPDTIIATWSQIALSPLPLPSTASFTALTSETATFAPYIANTVSWATQDAASVDIWGAVGPTGRRTFLAPQFPSIFADPPSDFPPFEAGCTDSRGKSVFATLDYGTSGVLSHEDLAQILAQGTLVAGDPVGGDEYYFYDWPAPALPAARGRRGRPRPRPRPVADERIGARSDRRDGGGRARRSQSDQGDRC